MDYKHYKAADNAMVFKQLVWLLIGVISAAIAYTSQADYEKCMEQKQSVAICGGGNHR